MRSVLSSSVVFPLTEVWTHSFIVSYITNYTYSSFVIRLWAPRFKRDSLQSTTTRIFVSPVYPTQGLECGIALPLALLVFHLGVHCCSELLHSFIIDNDNDALPNGQLLNMSSHTLAHYLWPWMTTIHIALHSRLIPNPFALVHPNLNPRALYHLT